MSIDFHCEGCGQAYRVGTDKAGLKLRCKLCGVVTPIPARHSGADGEVVVVTYAEPVEETYQQPRSHRSFSSTRSGRLKSVAKKKSQKTAIAIFAGAAAFLVVAIGAFFGVRALRSTSPGRVDGGLRTEGTPHQSSSGNGSAEKANPTKQSENPVASTARKVAPTNDSGRAPVPSEKLKQIGLAFHNYHEATGALPMSASSDQNGKPLLSWRVHLLPYLGEKRLYSQFKLDEPWDSTNNLPLVARMPDVYSSSGDSGDGKTRIMVFTGAGTPFNPAGPVKLADIRDGLSVTLLAVQTGSLKSVEWTKPKDLRFEGFESRLQLGLGPQANEDVQALMADGNVVVLSRSIPPLIFQVIVTCDAGDDPRSLLDHIRAGNRPSALSQQATPAK